MGYGIGIRITRMTKNGGDFGYLIKLSRSFEKIKIDSEDAKKYIVRSIYIVNGKFLADKTRYA